MDGRAHVGADVRGIWHRLLGRAAISAHRRRVLSALSDHSVGDRNGDHARLGERLSGATDARHPERDCRARRRRHRRLVPSGPPRAVRAARSVPVARRLRDAAAWSDESDAAERVGAARGDVVAGAAKRPASLLFIVVDRGRGARPRRCAPSVVLREGVQQSAGRRGAVGAPRGDLSVWASSARYRRRREA